MKNFKSKVDKYLWKRYDPSYEDQEHAFVNRKVEDEVRAEMDRDAQLLKAKVKLAEQQKGAK